MGEVLPIRILLADDHLVICEVLRFLFKQRTHFQLVAEAHSCREVIAAATFHQPDIIVLDLLLSDGNSLEYLPQIKAAAPGSKVIIFSGVEDEASLHRAVAAGALGWVKKSSPSEVLLRAIECVQAGEVWLEWALVAQVLGALTHHLPGSDSNFDKPTAHADSSLTTRPSSQVLSLQDSAKIALLTPREKEIIELIGQGLKNKQIADKLFLSEKTVHSHLASVFQKLEVSNRLELAVFAYRTGLISSAKLSSSSK